MREDGQRTVFTLGKTPGQERILVYDDMEGVLKWKTDGIVPIGISGKSQTHVYNGNWAYRIGREIYKPNGAIWRSYYRWIARGESDRVKASGLFRKGGVPSAFGYGIELTVVRSGVRRQWGFRYRGATGALYYYNSLGWWWTLWPLLAPGSDDAWHQLGFTVDLESSRYDLLLVDALVFNLSHLFGQTRSVWDGDSLKVGVMVGNQAYGTANVWVDDVLVRCI